MSNYYEKWQQRQEALFIERFNENSLDNGISSVVTITVDALLGGSNYIYVKNIPEGYIKVCESSKDCFSRLDSNAIFIKGMDAKGGIVTIKIHDEYKGLVIGKQGENIRNIARMINASYIKVI